MKPLCNLNSCLDENEAGQLDSWTAPEGITTRIDALDFVTAAMGSNLPPWRPIPSRAAADMLGVSLNALAQWRMRRVGARCEPWVPGRGNRVYYRPDRLAEWLSAGRCAEWQFSGWWLQRNGLIPGGALEKELVEAVIGSMESLQLFPEARVLWRTFRVTKPV